MTITSDIQQLEPGALVELFEVDCTAIGGDLLRFHGHLQQGSIWWQGNEFKPWPITASGFEKTGTAQQPSPTLAVGNVDGAISALCIYLKDLVGAKVMRRRTLGQYLDAVNFAAGNPTADPAEEMPPELWYIEQKSSETSVEVEFTLSSALDLNGQQLPGRQIVANVCQWLAKGGYRGPYCGYTRVSAPLSCPTSHVVTTGGWAAVTCTCSITLRRASCLLQVALQTSGSET